MAKKNIDLFKKVSELQEQLMLMYEDRDLKGYQSKYLLTDIKALEVEINEYNTQLLAEEYDLKEFEKLRASQIENLNSNIAKERDLVVSLEKARRNIRVATLRASSIGKIINEKEGDGYIADLETQTILDDMDITDFDISWFCREFSLIVPNISDDDFVLKMFSYFKSSETFKHYSDDDLALLFRRNFIVDGKRLTFKQIKEMYYPDGKTTDTYTKLYKIIKDKFRKHIKFHPDDVNFN